MRIVTVALFFIVIIINSPRVTAEEIFDIDKYRGKVVYLDFWASWCGPCRRSFPWMNKLRDKYSEEELLIIAVNLDKKSELAKDFLKANPANFEIVYDPRSNLAKKFKIPGMPSSILFDRRGKVVTVHQGFFIKKIPQYEEEIEIAMRPEAEANR